MSNLYRFIPCEIEFVIKGALTSLSRVIMSTLSPPYNTKIIHDLTIAPSFKYFQNNDSGPCYVLL